MTALDFAKKKVKVWTRRKKTATEKLKHWRREVEKRKPQPAQGIDVSVFQGDVNWSAVKASGVDFVYVKATEGEDFTDVRFLENVRGARAAGLKVGAYHFLRPRIRTGGAAAEVKDFVAALKRAGLGKGDLRPVLDVEASTLSPSATADYARDAIKSLRVQTGIKPIFYTFTFFNGGTWPADFAERADLWIANFGVDKPQLPRPWKSYAAHQWTEKGSVPGVSGHVDRNRAPDLKLLVA